MVTEITATVDRAIRENFSVENTEIELNALKMAMNITFSDLRVYVIPRILQEIKGNDDNEMKKNVKKMFQQWGMLIGKFVNDEEEQMECLKIIEVSIEERCCYFIAY